VLPPQIRDRVHPGSLIDAHAFPGKRLALEHGMAIMWDPPAELPSLEPTPAELAWKRWLMDAILAKSGNGGGPSSRDNDDKDAAPSETLTPAA
jgi:hypothetical protein